MTNPPADRTNALCELADLQHELRDLQRELNQKIAARLAQRLPQIASEAQGDDVAMVARVVKAVSEAHPLTVETFNAIMADNVYI